MVKWALNLKKKKSQRSQRVTEQAGTEEDIHTLFDCLPIHLMKEVMSYWQLLVAKAAEVSTAVSCVLTHRHAHGWPWNLDLMSNTALQAKTVMSHYKFVRVHLCIFLFVCVEGCVAGIAWILSTSSLSTQVDECYFSLNEHTCVEMHSYMHSMKIQ